MIYIITEIIIARRVVCVGYHAIACVPVREVAFNGEIIRSDWWLDFPCRLLGRWFGLLYIYFFLFQIEREYVLFRV